jgi:hypothetical protein
MQSVPISTKVLSSIPSHGEVYSKQHHLIKFANVEWQFGETLVSSINKANSYDIIEILLKMILKVHNSMKYKPP